MTGRGYGGCWASVRWWTVISAVIALSAAIQPAAAVQIPGQISTLLRPAQGRPPTKTVLRSVMVDCNSNGVPDADDIAAGTSTDVNGNSIPDECEPDCNTNGIPDEADISAGTSFDANESGVPDECEKIVYVNANADTSGLNNGASWETAALDLGEALSWAYWSPHVEEVWVAAGTYIPRYAPPGVCDWWDEGCWTSNPSFLVPNGLRLFGGFAGCESTVEQRDIAQNETILSGDRLGDDGPEFTNMDDNLEHVVALDSEGEIGNTVIDGFTITGGNGREGSGLFPGGRGSEIRNCRFVGNNALQGAAVSTEFSEDTLFVGCTFEGNRASIGAGIYEGRSANSRVTNCLFRENIASFGSGIYGERSDMIIVGCDFISNNGSAVSVVGGKPSISNSLFSGNSAMWGGALSVRSYPSGRRPVVVLAWPIVTNCTFFGNVTEDAGGGVHVSGVGQTTLRNCILWGNSDANGNSEVAQIVSLDSDPIIDYSAVQGWTGTLGGVGNIGADPRFVDPDGPDDVLGTPDDDLRLGFGSPCIDAGSNSFVPPDTFDLDGDGDITEPIPFDIAGRERFVDDPHTPDTGLGTPPIVDMGAYEYQVDCNVNDVRDEFDISGGTSLDCNMNSVPDECERDCDSDGVIDACDLCGDLDGDSDVDNTDYTAFRASFGRSVGHAAYLACADYDNDGVVGLRDYQAWLTCYRAFVGNAEAVPVGARSRTASVQESAAVTQ